MGFQELRKFFYERRRRREDYNFGGGFDDGQHNQITFQPKTETGRVAKEDRANLVCTYKLPFSLSLLV